MKRQHRQLGLSLFLILVASVFVIMNQYASAGVFWQWEQVRHHETIVVVLLAFGAGLLAEFLLNNK